MTDSTDFRPVPALRWFEDGCDIAADIRAFASEMQERLSKPYVYQAPALPAWADRKYSGWDGLVEAAHAELRVTFERRERTRAAGRRGRPRYRLKRRR